MCRNKLIMPFLFGMLGVVHLLKHSDGMSIELGAATSLSARYRTCKVAGRSSLIVQHTKFSTGFLYTVSSFSAKRLQDDSKVQLLKSGVESNPGPDGFSAEQMQQLGQLMSSTIRQVSATVSADIKKDLQQMITTAASTTETNIKEFINTKLGEVNNRVDAIEANVESIRVDAAGNANDIGLLRGEVALIKEQVAQFHPRLSTALQTVSTLESELYGNSLVLRGIMIETNAKPELVVKDLLLEIGITTPPVEVYLFGKPNNAGNRLIGLKMASNAEAVAILKKKSVLKNHAKYSKVYIDPKRSSSYLACERRMRQFIRIHGKDVELKKHKLGVVAVKENIVIPLHDFAHNVIQVGCIKFHLHDPEKPGQSSSSGVQSSKLTQSSKVSEKRRDDSRKRDRTSTDIVNNNNNNDNDSRASRLRHDGDNMDTHDKHLPMSANNPSS
jgi:hypothetical protein